MCSPGIIEWARGVAGQFAEAGLHFEDALEVGACDVNGSVRPVFAPLCGTYLGVDIMNGPGVDLVCDVESLTDMFEPERFELVISTEMVEHVRDWRMAFYQMMSVLKLGGMLVLSTRAPGFPLHAYPEDHWRYTVEDMRRIFMGWEHMIERDDTDPGGPGVFVVAKKDVHDWPWVPEAWMGIELARPW